jgi:hypothetical protein
MMSLKEWILQWQKVAWNNVQNEEKEEETFIVTSQNTSSNSDN